MITINLFKKFISKMLLSGIMLRIVCNVSCIMAVPFEKSALFKQSENLSAKVFLAKEIRTQQFYTDILRNNTKEHILNVLRDSVSRLNSAKQELTECVVNCKIAKGKLNMAENQYDEVSNRFNLISTELSEICKQAEADSEKYKKTDLLIKELESNLTKSNNDYSEIILNYSHKDLLSGTTYKKSEEIFSRISGLKNQIDEQTKLKDKIFKEIATLNRKKNELQSSRAISIGSVRVALQDFEKARNKFNECSEKLKILQNKFDSINKIVITYYGETLIDPVFNYVDQISSKCDVMTIRQISLDLVSKLEFILYVFSHEDASKE